MVVRQDQSGFELFQSRIKALTDAHKAAGLDDESLTKGAITPIFVEPRGPQERTQKPGLDAPQEESKRAHVRREPSMCLFAKMRLENF